MQSFDWYRQIDDPEEPLDQGDLLVKLPVKERIVIVNGEPIGERLKRTAIVITQACDLQWDRIDHVLVCPVWNINSARALFNKKRPSGKRKSPREFYRSARTGNLRGWFSLDQCRLPAVASDYLIVQLDLVFQVEVGFARGFARKNLPRVRLLPPYREQLSQQFASNLMRVGRPLELPEEPAASPSAVNLCEE